MNRDRGYSLIEILIAVAIFAFVAATVTAMLSTTAAFHVRSMQRTEAALLAQSVLDEVRHKAHTTGDFPDSFNATHELFPGYYYDLYSYPLDYHHGEWLLEIIIRSHEIADLRKKDAPGPEGAGVHYYTIVTLK